MALRRLTREASKFAKEDVADGLSGGPVSDDDLFKWRCGISGAKLLKDTPMQEGNFYIELLISPDYPNKAPKVTIATQVWHPSVNDKGEVCLDILKDDAWSAAQNIESVCLAISSLLSAPSADGGINTEASSQLGSDKAAFDAKQLEYTRKYAM
jgi:ubiquitin-conjugating enzyme E2 D